MSQEAFQQKSTEAGEVVTRVRFVGGSAAITKLFGRGVTPTYVSTGLVDLIWDEFPGLYIGVDGWCFDATTSSTLKGFTVVPGAYNATTRTLRLSITNASESLTDLAALQNLTITVAFKRTGSGV